MHFSLSTLRKNSEKLIGYCFFNYYYLFFSFKSTFKKMSGKGKGRGKKAATAVQGKQKLGLW
jgi:hypothetical protein